MIHRMRNVPLRTVALVGILACGLWSGCERKQPGPVPVDARSSLSFSAWRADALPEHSPASWKKFDDAVTEIRFGIAREPNPPPSAGMMDEVYRRINGRSFDDVIRLGLMMQRQRLDAQRTALLDMVDANALLVAKPGDPDSAAELKRMLGRQQERLETMTRQIAAIDQELAPAGIALAAGDATNARHDAKPLDRDAALREFDVLIESRRDAGALKYGAWPVRVDATGALLPARLRPQFAEAKGAAAKTGATVLPVRIRGIWLIFDQPVATPQFSPAVTANLTPADLAHVNARWARAEAEEWARKTLHEFSAEELEGKLADARADAVGQRDAAEPGLRPPSIDVGTPKAIDLTPGVLEKPQIAPPSAPKK